jgi:DNA-binding protein H-NS
MISNLASARALIEADLEHARNVLNLWTHEVAELEKALEQINAVSDSRSALRAEYQGQKGSAPRLAASPDVNKEPKRGRKPAVVVDKSSKKTLSRKQRTVKQARKPVESKAVIPRQARSDKATKETRKSIERKNKAPAQPKYKDPNSDKTWAGRGRRPDWLVGAPEQYAIYNQSEQHSIAEPSEPRASKTEENSQVAA